MAAAVTDQVVIVFHWEEQFLCAEIIFEGLNLIFEIKNQYN